MIDSLIIRTQGERIKDRKYVCKDCAVLLALSGALKDTFIVALSPEVDIKCEVCGHERARFLVAPYERGIIICDRCLEERGGKHAWHRFKVVKEGDDLTCELCLRKGAKHIVPTPKSDIPEALKSRKYKKTKK